MEREIWFRRWLFGYVPVHWKGLALILGAVVCVLTCFVVLVACAQYFERPAIAFTIPVPFLYILITALRIAQRHAV
ncbi:hypothetical protein [Novosphingobium huizhouense]|uniref:hypothetical protein n=1 Tax=Novosphingobium huizhouense TaxID=2866625 RepID=UPI001CD8E79A|nr:hypothetical protein [Novosphingobium huizhouense]